MTTFHSALSTVDSILGAGASSERVLRLAGVAWRVASGLPTPASAARGHGVSFLEYLGLLSRNSALTLALPAPGVSGSARPGGPTASSSAPLLTASPLVAWHSATQLLTGRAAPMAAAAARPAAAPPPALAAPRMAARAAGRAGGRADGPRQGLWRHATPAASGLAPASSAAAASRSGAAAATRGCTRWGGAGHSRRDIGAGAGGDGGGVRLVPRPHMANYFGGSASVGSRGVGSCSNGPCYSSSRVALSSGSGAPSQRRHFGSGGSGSGSGSIESDRAASPPPAAAGIESGSGSSNSSGTSSSTSNSTSGSSTGGAAGSSSSRTPHRPHHRQPGEVVGAHVRRQLAPAAALDPVGAQDDEQHRPPQRHGDAAAVAAAGHAATAGEALKAVAASAAAGAAAGAGGAPERSAEAQAKAAAVREAAAAEAEAARAGLAPLDALRAPAPAAPQRSGPDAAGSSSTAAVHDAAGEAAAAAAAAEVAESYAHRFNGGVRKGGGAAAAATKSAASSRSLDGGAAAAAPSADGAGWDVRLLEGLTPSPQWYGGGPAAAVAAVPCGTIGYGSRAEVVARLPASIMLLRHAECMTLDELQAHERVPNHDIPLSPEGEAQARLLGRRLRPLLAAAGMHLFLYTSPFLRCSETTRLLADELGPELLSGCREAVQLREQDWGNFQDPRVQAMCKEERLRYGRFYYRFPAGESVADVYDRLTVFQDHLVRDMCSGRFQENTCVAIVSHGLTLRTFAMRWLHWTVRQFLEVYNIPNAEPVLLHKDVDPSYLAGANAALPFMPHHTKCLYRLTPRALELLRGADASMATSSGCWQGALLKPPPPPRLVLLRRQGDQQQQQGSAEQAAAEAAARAAAEAAERRLWEDVDGMVASE